ncbi:hypothetical protein ACQP2U_23815 [Nocardia sp. CA-084685]|uniref:hypothetical protein n=1 Tax=Nocardia sp. CA-084685 TaxID=3239970 RepID=UPI003D99A690
MQDSAEDGGVPTRASGNEDGDEQPDVAFTLGRSDPAGGASEAEAKAESQSKVSGQPPTPQALSAPVEAVLSSDVEAQARELAYDIGSRLAEVGPEGWTRLDAVFSVTVTDAFRRVFYTLADRTVVEAMPNESMLILARAQRELVAELEDEPWWRIIVGLSEDGEITVDYDYGDEPFPEGQLLSRQAYLNDLEVFPRERVPLWLAAYIANDGRQSRTAERAAFHAELDRVAGSRATLTENEFPSLGGIWARWVTLAAVFVGTGSQRGPRILPSLGWFEGAARSGSTLFLVPGGRAVLSGGVWNAPELEAAYNGAGEMPELYRGAPFWVANQVLNPRASQGMLSFCYWWDGTGWYRGDSPSPSEFASAVPGIWTVETVVNLVAARFGDEADRRVRAAARALLSAAERAEVRREHLVDLLAEDSDFDLDGAYYQFCLAGLTALEVAKITADEAKHRVRQFFTDAGHSLSDYPLDELVAERLDVGWMMWAPTGADEIVLGRALFYVADDGIVERSSSSQPPQDFATDFANRYRARLARTV